MGAADDDDVLTPRESGSLAIFETTCEEAIEKLRGDDSARADDLRERARDLLVEVRAWRDALPPPTERSSTVSKILELHRDVSEFVAMTQ